MALSNSLHARYRKPQHQTRVMFCLVGDPECDRVVIRKARQEVASGSCAVWFADIDSRRRGKRSAPPTFPSFEDLTALAGNIGAQCVSLHSPDGVAAIIEFARQEHIDRIVVHCEPRKFWNRWFRRSIARRLIEHGHGFQIELVGLGGREQSRYRAKVISINAGPKVVRTTFGVQRSRA